MRLSAPFAALAASLLVTALPVKRTVSPTDILVLRM